jgi:PPOX class probable F420-dependent enzyme
VRIPEEQARSLFAAGRVARLATIDPDGRPNLVPFVFALEGDTLYTSVDGKPKERRRLQRSANVERDPRVTVIVDSYDEDWDRVWWVRIRGQGRVLDEGPELEHARALLTEKYQQYTEDPPPGPVLAIRAVAWRGWSASPIE